MLGLPENRRGDAFLDQRRARAVFDFVKLRLALPLQAQQRARDRRPRKHSGVGIVEHIMEPVVIRFKRIVRQTIARVHPIALLEDIQLTADLPFNHVDDERSWTLLKRLFILIEWLGINEFLWPAIEGLMQVLCGRLAERHAGLYGGADQYAKDSHETAFERCLIVGDAPGLVVGQHRSNFTSELKQCVLKGFRWNERYNRGDLLQVAETKRSVAGIAPIVQAAIDVVTNIGEPDARAVRDRCEVPKYVAELFNDVRRISPVRGGVALLLLDDAQKSSNLAEQP
jgi:hypothetical protein